MLLPSVQPVILCGGSGTRLWPLSRQSLPKQFVPLIDGKSLLQLTFERLVPLLPERESVWTVTSEEHRFLAGDDATAAGVSARHLLEPAGRNTAAAMAAAAVNAKPEQILLFLPADHHILDDQLFVEKIRSSLSAVQGDAIFMLGISLSHPHTGYGYIQSGGKLAGGLEHIRAVRSFIEKAEIDRTIEFVTSADYFWNSGIFMIRAQSSIDALTKHAPDILAAVNKAVNLQRTDGSLVQLDPQAFGDCRAESFDYAVMERQHNSIVAPFEGA